MQHFHITCFHSCSIFSYNLQT